jgi:hypothetical protein
MNWGWLNWTYTICLTVGTGYTVLAFFLGQFGADHGHGGDSPEVGGNVGHVGADNAMHFPLLSPVVIAMFLTAFGAGGLVGLEVFAGKHPAWSIGAGAASGLAFAFILGSAMAWVFRRTIGTSQATESDIIGAEATVAVTIPASGVGKIVYEAAGTRFTASARSGAGTEIRQDAKVRIRQREGQLFIVDSVS